MNQDMLVWFHGKYDIDVTANDFGGGLFIRAFL